MLKDERKKEDNILPKKRGIFDVSIIEHRQRIAAAEPMAKPAPVSFMDTLVPLSDSSNAKNLRRIPARIFWPPLSSSEPPYPTLFYVPGTAFVAHESKFTQVTCSHICAHAKCSVIVINHRLAPEHSSSDAGQDVYEVMKFFLTSSPYKNLIDPSKVVVGGYSSGGNLAALMAIRAIQEGIPILMEVLLSPLVDLSRSLTAFKKFEERDSDISEEFVNWFLSLSVPEDQNPKDPSISPFWNKKTVLAKLPPTAIVWAENDRFRSDAEKYYEKLKALGIYIKKMILNGETHAYLWHNLEIVERVSYDVLTPAFNGASLSHRFIFVRPRLTVEKNKTHEAQGPSQTPAIRSRL